VGNQSNSNIGFETQLFNSKLGIVFDYYNKDTKDLLFNPELPGTAGAASPPYINVASMSNHGLDIELRYRNTFGDLGVAATVTYTSYNNKITKVANNGVNFFDYGGSRIGSFSRDMVGEPISAFYGYQVVGIFKNAAEVASAAEQDGAAPGFFRFANLNTASKDTTTGPNKGRQLIDPLDRTIIGNPNPKFTGGLNLALTYKNFDLSAFLYVCYGNDIFNWNKWWIDFWPSFQGQKSTQLLNDSWTP
jgi:TonB-dependent starch-binding outer membrane protein SusC